jgi:hypothetical protein
MVDQTLVMNFDSAFAANRAREEQLVLLNSARQIWPDIQAVDIAVNTKSSEPEVPSITEVDPALALVKEVFRAEIVQKEV